MAPLATGRTPSRLLQVAMDVEGKGSSPHKKLLTMTDEEVTPLLLQVKLCCPSKKAYERLSEPFFRC